MLIPNSKSNYYGVPNEINSFGLRDREFSLDKTENTVRIVFLEDSVTYGLGVRPEATFPRLFEGILNEETHSNRYETINAGVIGFNRYQQTKLFCIRFVKSFLSIVVFVLLYLA